jgi:choline-sulfatase
MLRELRHKYVYYVGAPPQLFDLEADPEECTDPAYARQRTAFETQLRGILDPEIVDKA